MPAMDYAEQRIQAWLGTKDRQVAWDRMIGERIKIARNECLQNAEKKRIAAASAGKLKGVRRSGAASRESGSDGTREDPDMFTQDAVAYRIGRWQAWFQKLESGERAVRAADAILIAEHLNVPVTRILGPLTDQEKKQWESYRKDARDARLQERVNVASLKARTVGKPRRYRFSLLKKPRAKTRAPSKRRR